MLASLLVAAVTVVSSASPASGTPGDSGTELKRGAFFGAKVSAVSDELRDQLKLDAGVGVAVDEVITGSTAADGGFKAGDVLLALNGAKIRGAGDFVQLVGGLKAGTRAAIEFRRGEVHREDSVTFKGRPLETSDAYEVIYGSVSSRGSRLRTIITRPRREGKRPALFLIQGVGLFSVDNPIGPLGSYRTILDDFTRHGFVTLRVDKPGCGDSEGGPARDVDFDAELDGYRQALRMLKARSDVDPDRIVVFGHSMGGVMAPLLAADTSVRGIIVYGTIARTWTEYMLENSRRQLELADTDPSAIHRNLQSAAALLTYLYGEKMSPGDIRVKYPQLRDMISQTITEDRYFVDRSLTFFRQLADKNLGAAWESYSGHALAIWGKGDFVSNEDDHALVARIINRDHPGQGTFLAMDGIDHGFYRAGSRRESFERGQAGRPGEFNPAIISVCRKWAENLVTASNADDTAQSALEREPQGWTDLLAHAGSKLDGWVRGPLPPGSKLNPRSQWSLDPATGYVVCEGNGGHEWLRWDHELGDFVFHVEWRFTPVPGKKGYNSGVYARNSADGTIWHQAQTGDGSGGHLFGNTRVGEGLKRFNLAQRQSPSRVKQAGEWNTFEITCRGKEMDLWVNGAVTNRWSECEVPRGYAGLEAEGWRIEFRNVKVKPLGQANTSKNENAKP
jgi:pimeloyl-ACP methyl ester carboxylesterase